MIHGILCRHVQLSKEGVGIAEVCIRRFRPKVKLAVFVPELPDPIIYRITPDLLTEIIHAATTPAEAVRLIWRAQPSDGLRRPSCGDAS